MGEREQSLIYKHNFKAIGKLWPALIEAQHSEKPSILKVIEKILNKLHKHISTMPLQMNVSKIIGNINLNKSVIYEIFFSSLNKLFQKLENFGQTKVILYPL